MTLQGRHTLQSILAYEACQPGGMKIGSNFSMGSSQFYLTVVLEVTALLGYLDLDLDAYGKLLTNKVACHPGNFCTLDPLKLSVWLFLRIAIIGGSEGGPRGAVPPLALPLPPLDSQYYIDTRNWNHAFTLYSEV